MTTPNIFDLILETHGVDLQGDEREVFAERLDDLVSEFTGGDRGPRARMIAALNLGVIRCGWELEDDYVMLRGSGADHAEILYEMIDACRMAPTVDEYKEYLSHVDCHDDDCSVCLS